MSHIRQSPVGKVLNRIFARTYRTDQVEYEQDKFHYCYTTTHFECKLNASFFMQRTTILFHKMLYLFFFFFLYSDCRLFALYFSVQICFSFKI